MVEQPGSLSNRAVAILLAAVTAIPVLVALVSIRYDQTVTDANSCDELTLLLEQQDVEHGMTKNAILLLGDASVRRWRHRPQKMGQTELMMRTARGLDASLVAGCFERAVAYYQPAITVFLTHKNELMASSKGLQDAIDQILERRDYYSVSPFLVFALPPNSPATPNYDPMLKSSVSLLQAVAENQSGVAVIDLSDSLNNTNGIPDARLFWPDGETPNNEGIRRLMQVLSNQISLQLLTP